MAHLLRLIAGYDKRNPIRTFTICSSSSTANVHLREGGFSPGFGEETVQWSGKTIRRDGQKRISTGVENVEIDLTYDLIGGSSAELRNIQGEINRFFLEVRMYEEERQAAPVWLEYRWQDGLDAIPAPVFGQFSQYLRVLYGRAGKWPGELHAADRLTAGNIEGVAARLICAPYWEGLQQTAVTGLGQLELTPHGVLVAGAVTNLITNPSFGHATFGTGWTPSANLQAIAETRPGFYRSTPVSVRLTNTTAGVLNYTQGLTLTAVVYIISCYVRREDGAAVTSADCVMYGQGAAQTTTFTQVDGSAFYLAWASFTGVAAASNHGIQIKAGKQVYVDDFQLETRNAVLLFPTPFCSGEKVGALWSGTAHNSSSSRVTGFQKQTIADELTSQFTFAGWYTPYWSTAQGTGTLVIFKYIVSVADIIELDFLLSSNTFQLSKTIDSVAVTDSAGTVRTFAYHDRIHIAVVQDETNLRLYVNGVLDASIVVAVAAKQPAAGLFSLGSDSAGGSNSHTAIDGVQIWKQAFTAAQVLSLYTAEVEIKTVAGGLVGEVPYFWTKDGDNILDAADDSGRNHWGVMGGISGDVEALTEWRIQPPTSTPPRVYWLARKATDENFTASLLWQEFIGTVDANSSAGEYNEQTSAAGVVYSSTLTTDLKVLQGHYQYLTRFYVATNSVSIVPRFGFGVFDLESLVSGRAQTIATNASFLLRDFGDLFITYNEKRLAPAVVTVYIYATPTTGTSTTRVDFLQLLPWPYCQVSVISSAAPTIAAGDLLIISGEEAYMRRTSSGGHNYTLEFQGKVVDVVPNKYNTIFFLPGEEGTTYDITDTGTFTVLITPRYTLPGGLVA